jgi:hypothetical protein
MKFISKSSAIAVALTAAIAMTGCASQSDLQSQNFVPAVEVPPPDLEADAISDRQNERLQRRIKNQEIAREIRNLDVDDYRHESGNIVMSSEPGWKDRRQLEIEKIHRLAKMCIAANNVSPPCLDIISINARAGKFFILQETKEFTPYMKKWGG